MDPYGAGAPPLYQTATFDQVSAVQRGPYDYTRSKNPTRDQLEAQMADLEVLSSLTPLYVCRPRLAGRCMHHRCTACTRARLPSFAPCIPAHRGWRLPQVVSSCSAMKARPYIPCASCSRGV